MGLGLGFGLAASKTLMLAYHGLVEPALVISLRRSRLDAFTAGDPAPETIPIRAFKGEGCSADCFFDADRPSGALWRYVDRAPAAADGGLRRAFQAVRRGLHPTPMVIPLERFPDVAAFEALIRKRSSRTLANARKAAEGGCRARVFARRLHIADMHAIKTSAAFRAGGPVSDYLFLRPEELGRPVKTPREPHERPCPRHWTMWWGAFLPRPGHSQGGVTVDEALVAYVKLRRIGDLVHYAEIMGHKDHLRRNMMILLHLEIMRWLIAAEDARAAGVRAVLYGGAEHGGSGLLTWKKRAGFAPAWLVHENAAGERR